MSNSLRQFVVVLLVLITCVSVSIGQRRSFFAPNRHIPCQPCCPPCTPCPILSCTPTESACEDRPDAGVEGVRLAKPILHTLLIGDTDDKVIGDADKADLDNTKLLIEQFIPANRRSTIVVIQGTPQGKDILAAIDRLSVRPVDTIFVLYSGHGGYDTRYAKDDPAQGQYLETGDTPYVLRKTVMEHLRAKKARLTVMLTDCCNEGGSLTDATPSVDGTRLPAQTNPLLDCLFFRQQGVVDITSSQRGMSSAVLRGDAGGCLTTAFITMCRQRAFPVSECPTWDEAYQYLYHKTNELYQQKASKITGQKSQFPVAIQISVRKL